MPTGRISRVSYHNSSVLIQPDGSGDDVFATFDVLEHAGVDFPTIGIPLIYELDNSPGKPFAASVKQLVD